MADPRTRGPVPAPFEVTSICFGELAGPGPSTTESRGPRLRGLDARVDRRQRGRDPWPPKRAIVCSNASADGIVRAVLEPEIGRDSE